MTVGECIKLLRESAGLTQTELADSAGISGSLLSLVESGKRDPSVKTLRDIARALEAPGAVLFAVALAEDEPKTRGPEAKLANELIERLLVATQHALAARRLQRLRKGKRK